MSHEERQEQALRAAEDARRDLGILGFPTEADDEKLHQWAQDRLGAEIKRSDMDVQAGKTTRPGTFFDVWLPKETATPFLRRRQLIHELGHCLLTDVRRGPQGANSDERLQSQKAEDEIMEMFVSEWLMPANLVQKHEDDDQLARLSGCPIEYVQQRRRELQV